MRSDADSSRSKQPLILGAVEHALRRVGLVGALRAGDVAVDSLPGATPAAVAIAIRSAGLDPIVLVADDPNEAEELFGDLESLGGHARYLPQRETLPYEDVDPHVEVAGQRTETLAALLRGSVHVIVTTARGLVERSPLPSGWTELVLRLTVGSRAGRSELVTRLEEMGFEGTYTVQELGDFAVRGGIVDVFAFGHERPLRIELWDDEIASLRSFDILTQRSVDRLDTVEILPLRLDTKASPASGRTERRALIELLPDSAVLMESPGSDGSERRARLWSETVEARENLDSGDALPPEALVVPAREYAALSGNKRRLTVGAQASALRLGLEAPPPVERDMGRLSAELRTRGNRGERVLVLCDNAGQLERLEAILSELSRGEVPASVQLALGSLSGGFGIGGPNPLLVLTDHEIFQRSRQLRRQRRFRGVATLESVASLQPGDYVVHLDHGVGVYRGLERVEVGGEAVETLKIEYADGESLRVPYYRIDLIERWQTGVGEGGPERPPRVHKLGGKQWQRTKRRTVEAIHEMAAELLEVYAHRHVAEGHAFGPETRWQHEMESSFLYEDTPDQHLAWEAVRLDMEKSRPMDRLICGDVGYGKTEVAIRAAFKAAQDGRQVALLAPTTVLVDQHARTFAERLAAFPVRIESLSRFLTRKQQAEVVAGVQSGAVDIVIGTHRLLSPDVEFKRLGLLIVDEEQRFGVRHKERLKALRSSVDALTLTATPIPRTLQLSLGGLRDMSLIETPPRDRMPIITHVLEWSDSILRDAMRRELDRGGQVFFVHDRVDSIGAVADRVRKLVPEAAVDVAHGQMPERALEVAMHGLMTGDTDILVCTTIIENGLDVPTANTMIVHRADNFGLAQLYQLRGRVGRSHHRAHCYLLVPPTVSPEGRQRLSVLEHHTDLGSGYQIALKDLQLRGAGNILGAQQSGFAQAVGFDTYQRLLERAVRRLRDGESEAGAATNVSVTGSAYLPDQYIVDPEQKMHLYRRVSRIREPREVDELAEELRDRFGPVPPEAERLLAAARLKLLGSALDVEWIQVAEDQVRINFREDAVPRLTVLRDAFADRQLEVEVRRPNPLSLVLHRAGVEPLLPTITDALAMLADPRGERSGRLTVTG